MVPEGMAQAGGRQGRDQGTAGLEDKDRDKTKDRMGDHRPQPGIETVAASGKAPRLLLPNRKQNG